MAAAIIVPLAYGAQGRETRAERSASTISQSADRGDARIAVLKAELRLSPDQAQHWAGLESALREIAQRAKSWEASHNLQTGRASSNVPVAPDAAITEDAQRRDADSGHDDARKARLDDIDEMRREADAHTVQAANLRQIADAAQPLYDPLDDNEVEDVAFDVALRIPPAPALMVDDENLALAAAIFEAD
ncbi:hypothetical protein RZS28_19570 (plasmid) [Methylocapsa polymorpha]|uniref:Secreted protein n=1 Tax=Methylocapsa polymorpha TaxID=3080828 RepID=A0ABZ0HY82_9HYPH|nr:hypothetical protein RZS28_19570 [Methylocapsa sp. RX1]